MKSECTLTGGTAASGVGAPGSAGSLLSSPRQLAALVELTTSALSQSSLDGLLWYVAHKVVEILDFEDCLLYLYDRDSEALILKAAHGPQASDRQLFGPQRIRLGEGLVGTCAQSMQTLLVEDTRKDVRYIIDDQQRLSELCVPIVSDGQLVGVIDSESFQPDFYTEEHVQLLTAVAAIIATKYQSYQSIESLQRSVDEQEKAKKLQQALFNIAELVYTTDSLDAFYRELHRHVVNMIAAEVFFVALLDSTGDRIDVPYPGERVTDYPFPAAIEREQFAQSLTAEVILGNQPIRLSGDQLQEIGSAGGHLPCSWAAQVHGWLAVPFTTPSGIRGAVGVQRVSEGAIFDHHDEELLTHIAQHISNAIKRKQDEHSLQRLALSDPLTGLPNRTLLIDRLNHALRRDRSVDNYQTHVFFIDLDRFKCINDAYGHHVGDEVLIEVGRRIQGCLRDSDTLARISGDEFAIVLQDISQPHVLNMIADRITSVFNRPARTSAGELQVAGSIGICSASSDLNGGEELLKTADHAMYKAKATGRGSVVISGEQDCHLSDSRRLEAEIASALSSDQFELHLQPIYHLNGSQVAGFEALVRWRHPELGLLFPDRFLDVAEKSGQIVALDFYVLTKSAELINRWERDGTEAPFLNVNLSGRTLTSADFVEQVTTIYRHHRLAPGALNIEVTEQCLIDDMQRAIERLNEIQALGSRVFLDDFGTGYSSLNYLHRLPVNVLKIDRSFVCSYHESDAARSIVKTIVLLADNLGLEVVAEGIEEPSHIDALNEMRVSYGQGYLLGRPMTPTQAEGLMGACKEG